MRKKNRSCKITCLITWMAVFVLCLDHLPTPSPGHLARAAPTDGQAQAPAPPKAGPSNSSSALNITRIEKEMSKEYMELVRMLMKEENLRYNGGGGPGRQETLDSVKEKQKHHIIKVMKSHNLNQYSAKFAKIIDKFGE